MGEIRDDILDANNVRLTVIEGEVSTNQDAIDDLQSIITEKTDNIIIDLGNATGATDAEIYELDRNCFIFLKILSH